LTLTAADEHPPTKARERKRQWALRSRELIR
jgi:hypothetical protein